MAKKKDRTKQRTYEAKHREKFLCKYCPQPVVSSGRCWHHYKKHLAYHRRATDKKGRKNPIPKYYYHGTKPRQPECPF